MNGPSAVEIRTWLTATGKTYEWYAEQLGVAKGTVAHWLKSTNAKPIPEIALRFIQILMKGELPVNPPDDLSPAELARQIEINAALLRQKLENPNSA